MWKYIIGIPIVLGITGFGYYAISPLFRNIEANDVVPGSVYAPETKMDETTPIQIGNVPVTRTLASAEVVDTAAHPASGMVRLIEANGTKYVRYEGFKTINGPDIFVYLSKDLEASDFIDLGRVKATEGNINYEIPEGVNPEEYPYVLTWCRAFGVLFNSAKLY